MDISLPNTTLDLLDVPTSDQLTPKMHSSHKPRILLLYGSTRPRSFSRLLVEEAERLLQHFGGETRVFNPSGLPLPDDAPDTHPKVQELRELVLWSEGQVWCSPERHGSMSAVFKAQIDWIPLAMMEELVKFTLLLRDRSDYLVDRYSERVETAGAVSRRVNQSSI